MRDGEEVRAGKRLYVPGRPCGGRGWEGRVIADAVMWSLPVMVPAIGVFVWLGRPAAGSRTDNAYVKGDRALVATELSGLIVEVPVQENQHVSRGQLLFRLDDQPYRLALAKIEAEMETPRADIWGACARSGAPSARRSRRR